MVTGMSSEYCSHCTKLNNRPIYHPPPVGKNCPNALYELSSLKERGPIIEKFILKLKDQLFTRSDYIALMKNILEIMKKEPLEGDKK